MVARVALHHMKQDRDEPIRAFVARLKGQAGVCKYVKACPGCNVQVAYTEAILTDFLCRGIADPEIQMDLLGDANQEMTLEQAIKFVEAKESGKRSASRLSTPQLAEAMGSTYRRQRKQTAPPPTPTGPDTCTYCGTKGHGKASPTRIRRIECPAYGQTCGNCNREHHLSKMCRNKGDHPPRGHQENAISNSVLQVISALHSNTVDHHTFDRSTHSWHKKQSRPQPYIAITAQTTLEDYSSLGQQLKKPLRRFTLASTPPDRRTILEDLATIPRPSTMTPPPVLPPQPIPSTPSPPPIPDTPQTPPPDSAPDIPFAQPPLPISPPIICPTTPATTRTTPREASPAQQPPLRRSQRTRKQPDWLF